MGIKIMTASGFEDVVDIRLHNGTDFESVQQVNVYDGEEWEKVWPTTTKTTVSSTYSISSAQIYWGTGGKEDDYTSQLIAGAYNASQSTSRRSLIIFPYAKIASDLAGAEIEKVELYLKRLNTEHGTKSCSVYIKKHNYSSVPTRWDGTDTGAADSGTPTMLRGEEKWLTLLNSVGEGLRDGTVKGLCLDTDSNYAIAAYGRFERASAKLRITYSKEV